MLRAVQEFVRLGLEVLDADPLVGRQDSGGQDLDVAVVARVVLCHQRTKPAVVTLMRCLPRLPIAQLRFCFGHLEEPAKDEVQLDRHRLLTPQGSVVVEHATRSSVGTASDPSPHVRPTKSWIACFAAPSRQLGSAPVADEPVTSVSGTTGTDGRATRWAHTSSETDEKQSAVTLTGRNRRPGERAHVRRRDGSYDDQLPARVDDVATSLAAVNRCGDAPGIVVGDSPQRDDAGGSRCRDSHCQRRAPRLSPHGYRDRKDQ